MVICDNKPIDYYLIIHRCLNIGASIVTVRTVTEETKMSNYLVATMMSVFAISKICNVRL